MKRPDPEELLARVQGDETRALRGKLTVFFGAAPGVGKTYAMLEAARAEKEQGRDVVVGIALTHGRYDTAALVLGHELVPKRRIVHKDILLEELDLDAVLSRRPGLVLVDELAHTNAPGCRHAKRWQDVEELLDAGIDVHTTLNVQHLESLNDVVAQITGVTVRETVPDRIFDSATDVRVVDLPIDDLLERLRDGKVYAGEQAAVASESFFRAGNLIALRELALRTTAQRVDAQMREYRARHGIERTWPVAERLLVCVSPSPASEKLVRTGRRLAMATHADWIVAYVETPAALRLPRAGQERIQKHLRLAIGLGAETVTLAGEHAPEEIVRFAKARNVTRILVGKPTHARWRDRFRAPFLDELVRLSGDVDVHVLSGEDTSRAPHATVTAPAPRNTELGGYGVAVVAVALITAIASALSGREHTADVAMAYLLGVTLVALRFGMGPSLLAGVFSVLAFDFVFIPPYFTFAVADLGHVVTFAVMLFVATLISSLTTRIRDQAHAAREREMRTASLYVLSRGLADARTSTDAAQIGGKHVATVFEGDVAVLMRRGPTFEAVGLAPWTIHVTPRDVEVAEWVWQHARPAGLGTDTLPGARALFVPLEASGAVQGVLAIVPHHPDGLAQLARRQQLDAFASQIGAALERARLASQAKEAQLRAEAEELRNALLSSVSHDLRTPLAVITGTASTLLEPHVDEPTRRELTQAIVDEAERLNRVVRNLLDMTRLEAGPVRVRDEWQPIEEAIGAALDRTSAVLGDRPIVTKLDDTLVPYDSILLQQLLVNLLENASKYTPAGSPLEITAVHDVRQKTMTVGVLDRGPGLPPGDAQRIFEKFYRGNRAPGGVGLGLTICRAIARAHGGTIWAEDREGGGAAFYFTLPLRGDAPAAVAPELVTEEAGSTA